MKVIKKKNDFGIDIVIMDDDKYIRFSYLGNLDLYWSFYNKNMDINNNYFIITKENYGVYRLFENLFNDIKNINLFDFDDIPFYIDNDRSRLEYVKKQLEYREEVMNRYRLFNQSNYNELFDKSTNTITWYSDETAHEVANILRIKQEDEIYRIEFFIQPYIEGYDRDFYTSNYIQIRFRNSGSLYQPFNSIFMKMYNCMTDVDDINDIGHQFYIEEYIYEREKMETNNSLVRKLS